MMRRDILASLAAIGIAGAAPALAQSGGTMAQVEDSGQLRIGVTSAEPWFYKDPMSEEWTGVGVAMGERMAEDLGVEMVPVETSWSNAVAALQANQIDMMFVLDPTEERRQALDFPENPLFYYAMGALVGEGYEGTSWDDLDQPDMRIGVTLGTSLDRNITEMMDEAEISRFSSNDEAIAAFAAGRVDAVVQFHPALVVQYARLQLGEVLLPEPVEPVATSVGLRKDNDGAFTDWVNDTIGTLYAEGVPDEIFDEYLESRGVDPEGIPGLVREDW
ncbi:transporter substrate-binding domain-containing protein [Palleronia sp. LCG004]|uniref:transporter substrate-binding domain-containing protein n=1 Tax=Palleronia sp. LCG004 TaxID=3079304 RepID=UPI002943897F|nr:transporter substrate-binding domain-containing protein [Palleronia sp. LCG004]WOI57713.1 transporter substrate-binding domain-containing protein [Palleronia sp. LCG004]